MKRTLVYSEENREKIRHFPSECGKISLCMNTSSDNNIKKPKIVEALLAGFNTIAGKPYLILLPILLDLFLWFGPGWRVDNVFKPVLDNLQKLSGTGQFRISRCVGRLSNFLERTAGQFQSGSDSADLFLLVSPA